MKRVHQIVIMAFLALIPCPGKAQENLIINPGFEDGLVPWEPYSGLKDGMHVSIDSSGGYSGNNLLKITTPAEFASGELGAGVAQDSIPCSPGNYSYTAWLMGDSTYLGVILRGLDSFGDPFIRWIGGSDWEIKASPDKWEQVSYNTNITISEGETNLFLRLIIYSNKQEAGTVVAMDDISLHANSPSDVATYDKGTINVYPNPVENVLYLKLLSAESRISLYDLSGKLHFEKMFPTTSGALNVSSLAGGMYIILVNDIYFQGFVKL